MTKDYALRLKAIAGVCLTALCVQSAVLAAHTNQSKRVWTVEKPLYQELLSNKPAGLQREGAIYWFHSGLYKSLRPFSLCYGLRFSRAEAYQELIDKKLIPISDLRMVDEYYTPITKNQKPVKVLFVPDYRGSIEQGAPIADGRPFILDPRSKAAYFEDLRKGLQKYPDRIMAVYSMDEGYDTTLRNGIKFFKEQKDTYPFIREVDNQIREKYGFGKYGIPTSMDDPNPYRWIAYRRWVNAQFVEWQKDIRAELAKQHSKAIVISMDPMSGNRPYALDEVAPYVDIFTQQFFPTANPNRCEFGFLTKFNVDLTGKKVWPCAQVAHYAYDPTPDEVRELMSQIFRNGGTGLHLYLPDVSADGAVGDTRLTKIGAPERYQAIMQTVDRVSRMNEVQMPKPSTTMLFYSEDNYQSTPTIEYSGNDFSGPNEIEYAYTFFGPVAERWFQIVSDNQLEGKRASLNNYKVVVLPAAKYERRDVAQQIADWVKDGGTLICGDPEAFQTDPDGSSLENVRADLKLPACGKSLSAKNIRFVASDDFSGAFSNKVLPVSSEAFRITASSPDSQVLAKFTDGSPAVLKTKVGKGEVLYFATNPFTESNLGNSSWKQFFTKLSDNLGLNREKVWKFELPPYKIHVTEPVGKCLTGNYIRWYQDKPVTTKDLSLAGSYSYSMAPDLINDSAENSISFTAGKLTDRRKAVKTKSEELIPEKFSVCWKNPAETSVLFDFKKAYPILSAHFWYSGELPATSLYGSLDGRKWTLIASKPAGETTQDVLDVQLNAAKAQSFRFVKLTLGKRESSGEFTLAETEIWSQR